MSHGKATSREEPAKNPTGAGLWDLQSASHCCQHSGLGSSVATGLQCCNRGCKCSSSLVPLPRWRPGWSISVTHKVWGALACAVEMSAWAHASLDLAAAAPQDGTSQAEIQQLQNHLEHPPCALQPPGEPVTWAIYGAPLGLWPCWGTVGASNSGLMGSWSTVEKMWKSLDLFKGVVLWLIPYWCSHRWML